MNCRNCNARIDYNYLKNCPQCGSEVEAGNLPKLDPTIKSVNQKPVWLFLANVIYVLFTGAVGMVAGAVTLYLSAGVIYMALQTPETYPGENCARGMALGTLSIFLGAFLGTIGGTVFAVKHAIKSGVTTEGHPYK